MTRVIKQLHSRDTRLHYCPPDHWLSSKVELQVDLVRTNNMSMILDFFTHVSLQRTPQLFFIIFLRYEFKIFQTSFFGVKSFNPKFCLVGCFCVEKLHFTYKTLMNIYT